MNCHSAAWDVGMGVGVVDEHGNFLGANLLRSVAEHEQHGVDHVALATPVRPHYGCEAFVKWAQNLFS